MNVYISEVLHFHNWLHTVFYRFETSLPENKKRYDGTDDQQQDD